MLAGFTDSIEEEIYKRHLQSFFSSNKDLFFCTKHVGNRLVIVSHKTIEDRRLQHFLCNNFYPHPVEHEHVGSKDAVEGYLGFDLQNFNYSIIDFSFCFDQIVGRFENPTVQDTKDIVQVQLPFTVPELILNNMFAWPPHIREAHLHRLRQNFTAAGYTSI